MPKRSSKNPTRMDDINQIAKWVVDGATIDEEVDRDDILNEGSGKNPAAVALGRLGGLKGGKARAAKLTKAQRTAIARKAAQARWKSNG